MADELRRVRTQAEREVERWRLVADTRPGFATWPQTAPGNPSWWQRHDQQPEEPETWCVCGAPDSGPCPQCLPADAVARVVDSRQHLGPPVDGETCAKWCGFCHLNNGEPEPLPERTDDRPLPPIPDSADPPGAVDLPVEVAAFKLGMVLREHPPAIGEALTNLPPPRRWWHRLTRRNP